MLLKKCTMPVKAIANSMGKNNMKTGVKMVPKPKPEKNVRMEVAKAVMQMIMISISDSISLMPSSYHEIVLR